MKRLKVFEAFSGYGSQSLELKELGINHEVVGTSEYEYNAIIAYSALHNNFADINNVSHDDMKKYLMERNIGFDFKKNKSKIPRMRKDVLEKVYSAAIGQKCYGDISLIKPDDIPDMDLFTYSFPCQDISVAGNGKGFDEDSETRSSLLWESRKIIKNKKPKFLMMENVKNIISKKHKPNFEKWIAWLESNGYNNYYKLINAKDCGIPQNRQRVFLVSILKQYDDGLFHFEDDFYSGLMASDFMDDIVDKKYYMDNKKSEKIIDIYIKSNDKVNALDMVGLLDMKGNESIRRVYNPSGICPTVSTCQGGHREPKFIIYDDYNNNVRGDQDTIGTITGNIGNISPRNSFKLIEKKIIQNNHGYNKGGVHDLAPTLTSNSYQENNFLLEIYDKQGGYAVRKLTPKEAFRFMGLNELEIEKIQNVGISNSQQYKLAGNSIVKQMMVFLKNLPYDNL